MFVVIQVKQNLKLKLETQFQLKAYSLIPILDVVKEHNRENTRTSKNVVPEVTWRTKELGSFAQRPE